jgi:hypothetical protein
MGMRQAMDVQEPRNHSGIVVPSDQEEDVRKKQALPDQDPSPYLVPSLARSGPCAPTSRLCEG